MISEVTVQIGQDQDTNEYGNHDDELSSWLDLNYIIGSLVAMLTSIFTIAGQSMVEISDVESVMSLASEVG